MKWQLCPKRILRKSTLALHCHVTFQRKWVFLQHFTRSVKKSPYFQAFLIMDVLEPTPRPPALFATNESYSIWKSWRTCFAAKRTNLKSTVKNSVSFFPQWSHYAKQNIPGKMPNLFVWFINVVIAFVFGPFIFRHLHPFSHSPQPFGPALSPAVPPPSLTRSLPNQRAFERSTIIKYSLGRDFRIKRNFATIGTPRN